MPECSKDGCIVKQSKLNPGNLCRVCYDLENSSHESQSSHRDQNNLFDTITNAGHQNYIKSE